MKSHQYNYYPPSPAAFAAYYRQQQRGRGPYGQIYSGARFVRQQQGAGFGSFLSSIVRGVSNLIARTPSWVKTGAKIGAESALRGLADYGDEVRAGVDPQEARKRAFRSALGEALEKGGKRMKGEGMKKRCRRQKTKRKNKSVARGKGKRKCCRLQTISAAMKGKGKRRRRATRKKENLLSKGRRLRSAIKGRSRFDLLSL